MLKVDDKDCVELNVRDLIYYYLYKQYDIHFLDFDVSLVAFEDMDYELMDNGCRLIVEVKQHVR